MNSRKVKIWGELLMKKAYVKPVFFAEEFAAATSYIASACGISIWETLLIEPGKTTCSAHTNCNHKIDSAGMAQSGMYGGSVKDPNSDTGYRVNNSEDFTYWDYAQTGSGDDAKTYLFNSGIAACDFLWSGNNSDNIYVWNSVDKDAADTSNGFAKDLIDTLKSLTGFFSSNEGMGGGHSVGYNSESFRS